MKNEQKTIVFKVSDNIKDNIIEHYQDSMRDKKPPYSVFQAEEGGTVVTLYESGKIMFQGITADIDAQLWIDQEQYFNKRDIKGELKAKDDKLNDKTNYYFDAIGSDEVGTGDYFGPLVFCATYVNKLNRKLLEDLKITDSKKMTDEKILRCAPIIMNKIPYYSKIVSPYEYNEMTKKGYNMNKIKALSHNEILYNLSQKITDYQKIIIDQFCEPYSYFRYLKEENAENKITKMTFVTKGETKNLSIAAASVISRYLFLKEMDKLSEKYNMTIPKNAQDAANKAAKEILTKYGKQELYKVVKYNFSNTKKIS